MGTPKATGGGALTSERLRAAVLELAEMAAAWESRSRHATAADARDEKALLRVVEIVERRAGKRPQVRADLAGVDLVADLVAGYEVARGRWKEWDDEGRAIVSSPQTADEERAAVRRAFATYYVRTAGVDAHDELSDEEIDKRCRLSDDEIDAYRFDREKFANRSSTRDGGVQAQAEAAAALLARKCERTARYWRERTAREPRGDFAPEDGDAGGYFGAPIDAGALRRYLEQLAR